MKNQNLALTFILLTVGLDAIGIGLIFPVMPDLMQSVTQGTLANAALWGGVITSAFAVMQFLCGPIIGNLSDHFGRRPVLLTSLAFMVVDYVGDGGGGHGVAAADHPHRGGHHGGHPFHRLRLCGRHLDPGSTRQTLWPCRRGLWHGLCRRPADRRRAGQYRPARPVLGRCSAGRRQLCLRLLHPARKPGPRKPPPLHPRPRQPAVVLCRHPPPAGAETAADRCSSSMP